MATSGKPLDNQTRQQIVRLREQGVSVRETAKATMTSTRTVQKHTRRPIVS